MNRKPYIRYTVLGILLFLALLCVIRIAIPNKEWIYSGSTAFMEGEACTDRAVYEHIALGRGVYRVELSYESTGDANAICNVKDGTVYQGGLLCNGEHLYRALDHTSYDFWLYEPTEELVITVDYSGQDQLTTGDLKIVETNLLWTRYLVILIALALFIEGTLRFERQKERNEGGEARRRVIFGIGVIAFVASIPYFYDGLISGADLTYHLQRIEGVKDGLLTGQFPVRLEPRWVFDHGYANGIFYCNLLLYFPALLRMAGFTVTESYILYCIALNIATAAIAWYCFGKMFRNHVIGLVCSGLYTLSIFRIYKLLITGAVGEGSAFTFLPLVLYGIYLVFEENVENKEFSQSWLILGMGYAGLIQTHVLTCEITAVMTVLLCVLYLRKVFELPRFRQLMQGALLALGLSLWYLVPFVDYYMTQDMKIQHASARTIQERGAILPQLVHQFWISGQNTPLGDNGMQYSHPVGVGLILVVGVLVFWLLLFFGGLPKKKNPEMRFTIKAAGLGCLALWMSTNYFPWDSIQNTSQIAATLVSSLQFPNRFLGWGTAFLAVPAGYVLKYFKNNRRMLYQMSLVTVLVALSTSYLYLMDSEDQETDYYLYNEESMGFGYISGEEYLIYGTDSEQLSFAKPEAGEKISITEYTKKGLNTTFFCQNTGEEQERITLPVLLYKGYEAVGESGEKIEIADHANHLLQVCVPGSYTGQITVRFTEPWYWRAAEVITLLTIIGMSFWLLQKRRNR